MIKRKKKSDEVVEALIVDPLPLVPEGGFAPQDFPKVSVALIPYGSQSFVRPDPVSSINSDGWLFIDTGNVRFAVPSRDEWNKLSVMIESLYNSHELEQQKENTDGNSQFDGQGQPAGSLSSNGQQ